MDEEHSGQTAPAADFEIEFQTRTPFFLKKREEEEQAVSLWLITFTDIMALMLTFFVLLYSMTVPDEEKWQDITYGLTQGLSKFDSARFFQGSQDTIEIGRISSVRALNLDYLSGLVREVIDSDEKLIDTIMISKDDRIIISLPDSLLFNPGSAEVTARGKRALYSLGALLSRIRNRIEINGNIDPALAQNLDTDGEWALSLNRAAAVAAALENIGYGRPITIHGLSSARYEELPGIVGGALRDNLSRRTDIEIMQDSALRGMFMQ